MTDSNSNKARESFKSKYGKKVKSEQFNTKLLGNNERKMNNP